MKTIYYFSLCLKEQAKYSKSWSEIETALQTQNAAYDFISGARDIWARDFMPFQRHDGAFVVYKYNPDYLQGRLSKYATNCWTAFKEVSNSSTIHYETDLVIDGGNIIKCRDRKGAPCVIMTTKVLYENPHLSHCAILSELEKVFDAEVILIPWDMAEEYGHADGMVRSIDDGKLLMNCYDDMDDALGVALRKALLNRFELCELHYGSQFQENSWCHLNYLELSDAVLVPVANLASDNLALEQIGRALGKKCIPISMAPIVAAGGAMHCISWAMDLKDV